MKLCSLVIFILFALNTSPNQAAEVTPPRDELINKYINLALSANEEKIIGSGPLRCEFTMPHIFPISVNRQLTTYGEAGDQKLTTQRLGLLCIKYRCENINELLSHSYKLISASPNADQIEFMKSQGRTEEEIQSFLANKDNPPRSDNITCLNTLSSWSTFIYDSCFASPMTCTVE